MIDLTGVTHHPAIDEIVEVICNKTENTDKGFFRTEVAYFLGKMASCMRATIVTKDRGIQPVNVYALALATSGYGKGHSVNVMENDIIAGFKRRFMGDTMTVKSEEHFWPIAQDNAAKNQTDPQEEYEKVQKKYQRLGPYPFTFADGTKEGVREIRYKLLLAGIGAINLQIDEIGSNLVGATDLLNIYLELYDQGLIKGKLTKNTTDNQRHEEIDGRTPTNMLLFGTPATLFDGAQTEDQFYAMLAAGYARRCLFGIGQQSRKAFHSMTPEEIFARKTQPANDATVQKWATHFHDLADPQMFGWKMAVEDDVAIQLIRYQIACEKAAEQMPEIGAEVRKAEMSHRHAKALKLAGALAFVDQSNEVEMDHLLQAILLVEESGASFQSILKREKPHVKLGKYIATCGEEVTEHDLGDALPFYKGSPANRNDMMNQAMSWGYKNNVVIRKTFVDGIPVFRGETLAETDLTKIRVSYSDNWAYDYLGEEVPFEELYNLTQAPGMHWANHHFKNGHRAEENVLPGFNMLVLDVDGGVSIDLAHDLLKEVKFLTYTTKRHRTPGHGDRFRLLIPTNYVLELDKEDYAELVGGVIDWLPFQASADVDASSKQRSKKWMSHENGAYHYNTEGTLFDILPFIPKTRKNEDYRKDFKKVADYDNLERWFAQRIGGEGSGRNNQMIKFALALVDSGLPMAEVMARVRAFDQKLSSPLGEDELNRSIFVTVAKRFQKQAA